MVYLVNVQLRGEINVQYIWPSRNASIFVIHKFTFNYWSSSVNMIRFNATVKVNFPSQFSIKFLMYKLVHRNIQSSVLKLLFFLAVFWM